MSYTFCLFVCLLVGIFGFALVYFSLLSCMSKGMPEYSKGLLSF